MLSVISHSVLTRSLSTTTRSSLPTLKVLVYMSSGIDSLYVSHLLASHDPATLSLLSASYSHRRTFPLHRPRLDLSKGFDLEVTGVHLSTWSTPTSPCPTATLDYQMCQSQARDIGSPFSPHVLTRNHEPSYWSDVFQPLLSSYSNSSSSPRLHTPNPDALCNSRVKFAPHVTSELLQKHDLICTGHYASLCPTTNRLMQAEDRGKDQSYFLSLVPDFEGVCFPLSSVRKSCIRRRLRDAGLGRYADKKESMGLCMVPEAGDEFAKFLDSNGAGDGDGAESGTYVNIDTGEVVGSWSSSPGSCRRRSDPRYLTLGQGARVPGAKGKMFFAGRGVEGEVLVCEGTHHPVLYADVVGCDDGFNWYGGEGVGEAYGRVRHGQPLIPCVYERRGEGSCVVKFRKAVRGCVAGQVVALYDSEGVVIGGGVIGCVGESYWERGEKVGERAKAGGNDLSVA